MAGHAAGHGRPDSSGRDAYTPGYDVPGSAAGRIAPPTRAIPAGAIRDGAIRDGATPAGGMRHQARSGTTAKGFLGSLFDFGFTSFVTPKIIKVLYVLIMIGTVITA